MPHIVTPICFYVKNKEVKCELKINDPDRDVKEVDLARYRNLLFWIECQFALIITIKNYDANFEKFIWIRKTDLTTLYNKG